MTVTFPAASVVIPVHNAERTLAEQLEAFASQAEAPSFDVTIVLNRCTDRSRSVAESFGERLDLHIVDADGRASAAYARNRGAGCSAGEVLLFCDADDRVDPGWVRAMHDELVSTDADFVGGVLSIDRTNLPDWAYSCYYQEPKEPTLHEVDGLLYPISASLGISRIAFEDVHGFDESFAGAGAEEIDLAVRLLRSGYRVGLARDAHVRYRPRTTVRGIVGQQKSYALGSQAFNKKEGRSVAIAPLSSRVKTLGRSMARRIIRDHEFSARAHATKALTEYAWLRMGDVVPSMSAHVAEDPPFDFVVPLGTAQVGGLAFRAEQGVGRWYATSGVEATSLSVVDALLPNGGTFVDCGANIGVFSVCAARRVGPDGRVIAFEPDGRTNRTLEVNLRRHQVSEWAEIHRCAVGAARGRLTFKKYANDVVSGFFEAPPEYSPGDLIAETPVEVYTLDEVVGTSPDMIKIDVEGAEPDVLSGARSLLGQGGHTLLMVELNSKALAAGGRSVDDLLGCLPTSRWSLWMIRDHPDRGQERITPFSPDDPALHTGYCNLLAIPQDRVGTIAPRLRSL